MKIVMSSGHGKYVRGASGYLDEVDEARRVVEAAATKMRSLGAEVITYHDDVSRSQNENLNRIVDFHNSKDRDLDVSVHFNAGANNTSAPVGDEVLYITQSQLAAQVASAISSAGHWPNRGGKKRTDLFFLNNTVEPAILIETCFVDSSADAALYEQHFDSICTAIAQSVTGIEEPVPGPEPEPEPTSAKIEMKVSGNVSIYINGELVYEHEQEPEPDEIPSWQKNIIATFFYGDGSPGAYGIPIPGKNSPAKYLSLPWKDQAIKGKQVEVTNVANGKTDIGVVWDLGPWCTSDNYPSKKARPIAEKYKDRPLPDVPEVPEHNVGRVSNGAGIDLSPALAKSIGIDGMGKVNWKFVEAVA